MIEIPESYALSKQINDTIFGKIIVDVVVNTSPHKFAWFYEDPNNYPTMLINKKIGKATPLGGMIEIEVEDVMMLFGDGVNIHFFTKDQKLPSKHQLLIKFTDGSVLVFSVQMYGGMWVFPIGKFLNQYYLIALEKPSPLTDEFNRDYFDNIVRQHKDSRLSIKAFLATEQRIPGLGNGVLQDILYNSRMNPRTKINSLTKQDFDRIYNSIKDTLKEMAIQNGRDTETDLFGKKGGYKTKLSSKTYHFPCVDCGNKIIKEAYLGGSVYYCESCQPK